MTLKGVTYTKKADAGKMLLAICKEYPMSAPAEIGSYRGFKIEVFYDTVNAHYCLNLCGARKYKVDLGMDALGNLTRIENELAKLPARLEAAKTKKAETIAQLEIAKVEVEKKAMEKRAVEAEKKKAASATEDEKAIAKLETDGTAERPQH